MVQLLHRRIYIISAILILFGIIIFLFKNRLSGKYPVKFKGLEFLSEDDLFNAGSLNKYVTSNFDTARLTELLKLHPRIDEVTVSLSDALHIQIVEKKSSIIIFSDNNLYEVDNKLNILSENYVKNTDLKILSIDFPITLVNANAVLPSRLINIIKKIIKLNSLYPVISSWISEFIYKKNHLSAIIKGHKMKAHFGINISELKIRKLHSVLSYLQRNNLKPLYIDLAGEDVLYQ